MGSSVSRSSDSVSRTAASIKNMFGGSKDACCAAPVVSCVPPPVPSQSHADRVRAKLGHAFPELTPQAVDAWTAVLSDTDKFYGAFFASLCSGSREKKEALELCIQEAAAGSQQLEFHRSGPTRQPCDREKSVRIVAELDRNAAIVAEPNQRRLFGLEEQDPRMPVSLFFIEMDYNHPSLHPWVTNSPIPTAGTRARAGPFASAPLTIGLRVGTHLFIWTPCGLVFPFTELVDVHVRLKAQMELSTLGGPEAVYDSCFKYLRVLTNLISAASANTLPVGATDRARLKDLARHCVGYNTTYDHLLQTRNFVHFLEDALHTLGLPQQGRFFSYLSSLKITGNVVIGLHNRSKFRTRTDLHRFARGNWHTNCTDEERQLLCSFEDVFEARESCGRDLDGSAALPALGDRFDFHSVV